MVNVYFVISGCSLISKQKVVYLKFLNSADFNDFGAGGSRFRESDVLIYLKEKHGRKIK